MKKVLTGNEAAAWGAARARAEVVAAYPITPQTTIIETLADLAAAREMNAEFITVESEHSALAACLGAAQAGARVFTATSSQGLALMHELIHWAAAARLPLVLVNVNRSMAPGWSIWTDQNDSLSQRDTGWFQYYCRDSQEVLDTVLQAYRTAEQVLMPAMVVLDAFVLSHTSEVVDVPEPSEVDAYLPPYRPEYKLDVDHPRAFGGLLRPDYYQEMRAKMHRALVRGLDVALEADAEFGRRFGRSYGIVDPYRLEDAETVLVASATVASTARLVIDEYREKGEKVGMLRMRLFRPFPVADVRRLLAGRKRVAVFDRNISYGHHGIFCEELKSALYNHRGNGSLPSVFGYVGGLGGRDVTLDSIREVLDRTLAMDAPEEDLVWIGHKE